MPRSRRPAVVRGFSAASLAVFAALAGHVTAGGAMPGPIGILVPWILASMVCVLLAGRKLSVIRLSISVVVSQFLFHVLFVLGTITPSGTVSGHVHGAPMQLPAVTASTGAMAADATMWLGHAVAALTTIVALHRGERLLVTLTRLAAQAVRWLRRRLDAVLVAPRVLSSRRLLLVLDAHPRPASLLLATLRGRGPPLVTAV